MKRIIFLFLLYLCLNTFAQSDFRPGYYITNNGDTIFGLLDYRGDISNSTECIFIKDIGSEKLKFLPGEIKSYRFNESKFYISKELPKDSMGQTKKVFLEWLIKGKASILAYASPMYIHFYILLDNDSLYELLNTKHILTSEYGTKYEHERKEYVGVLKYYFKDCPSLSSNIENTKFTSGSLINIAKSYHEKVCKNEECIVFENKNRKINFSIAPVFSYYYSKTYMVNGYSELINPLKTTGYGVMLNFSNLPFVYHNLSIQLECIYYDSNYTINTTGYSYPYDNNRLFELNIIRMPLSVRYTFPFRFIRPFISAGPTYSLRTVKNINKRSMYLLWLTSDYVSPSQFSINSNAGFDILLNNSFKIEIGGCFERGFKFISGWVGDYSYNNSFIFEFGLIYSIK